MVPILALRREAFVLNELSWSPGSIKAYAPDIAFAPDGSFLVAWHEEQFPFIKTVVQPVRLPRAR